MSAVRAWNFSIKWTRGRKKAKFHWKLTSVFWNTLTAYNIGFLLLHNPAWTLQFCSCMVSWKTTEFLGKQLSCSLPPLLAARWWSLVLAAEVACMPFVWYQCHSLDLRWCSCFQLCSFPGVAHRLSALPAHSFCLYLSLLKGQHPGVRPYLYFLPRRTCNWTSFRTGMKLLLLYKGGFKAQGKIDL